MLGQDMLTVELTSIAAAMADHGTSIKSHFANDLPWLQSTVVSVFAGLNTIRVMAYIPQILKAANDSNGAMAISYTTWGLFFLSNLTTIVYSVVCLGDLLMGMIFFGNAVACLVIIAVTFVKRRNFRLRNTARAKNVIDDHALDWSGKS